MEQQVIAAGGAGSQAEADVINQAITENGEKVLVGPVVIEKRGDGRDGSYFLIKSSLDVQLRTPSVSEVRTSPVESGTPRSGSVSDKPKNSYLPASTSVGGVFFTLREIFSGISTL
jgi:hypothetical protein